MKKKKLTFKKVILKALDILYADGKSSIDRVLSLFSALFWTWLEFSFFVFFFTFAFGIAAYVTGGTYAYSWEVIKNNRDLMDALIKAFVLIIFILRVPIHYGKNLKERK